MVRREDPSSREAVDEVGVDRADHGLPREDGGTQVRLVPQELLQLGGGEVAVEREAGEVLDPAGVAGRGELAAHGVSPPALPDDGVVQGLPARAVEDHERLALVREAQAGGAADRLGSLARELGKALDDVAVDLVGVVLDPARPGVDLPMGPRGLAVDAAGFVEEDGFRPRRALVDGEDVTHRAPFPLGAEAASRFTPGRSARAAAARPSGLIP